jgi:hypothetical protein
VEVDPVVPPVAVPVVAPFVAPVEEPAPPLLPQLTATTARMAASSTNDRLRSVDLFIVCLLVRSSVVRGSRFAIRHQPPLS